MEKAIVVSKERLKMKLENGKTHPVPEQVEPIYQNGHFMKSNIVNDIPIKIPTSLFTELEKKSYTIVEELREIQNN